MSKFQEALDLYTSEFKNTLNMTPDANLLKAVTRACGPSIYNKDSAKVSASDKAERDLVKNNFLIRKLGLQDGPALDAAIQEVAVQMGSSNKNKYRAMFYYLLVKKFGKEGLFV